MEELLWHKILDFEDCIEMGNYILAFGKHKEEEHEFEANLCYITKASLQKTKP